MSLSVGQVDENAELASELTLFTVGGLVSQTKNIYDKATIIEREIGMEPLYTLIALGESLNTIAESIRMTAKELKVILTRTTDYRNRYMKASLFAASEDSVDTLTVFSRTASLDKEEAAAAKHHRDMVKLFLDASGDARELGSGVIVNNVISVGDKDQIPPMSEALSEVYYGDIIDADPEP